MSAEIKPCPFCGAEAGAGHTLVWWVSCADPDCGVEGPARSSEAECIAAWNAAPRLPRATTPLPNTVRVRVAVSVSSNGSWSAIGGSAWASLAELSEVHMDGEGSWLDNGDGDRLTWITADVPKPEPAAEIEAEVEPSTENR